MGGSFKFAILLLVTGCSLRAGSITVPNHSFEAPVIEFVSFGAIDVWEKNPKPDWYDDGGGSFQWFQLTGVFKNSAPSAGDHIHNCDGNQALWLFVVPETGLFQDATSTNGLNAQFEPGKSYTLTTGFIGGGGGMREGATLEASLYYRDEGSNMVTVASKTITHSFATFPDKTNFVDQSVFVATVRNTDPWAGKNIGIRFLSTVDTNLQGGYWDLDNVRLTSVLEPVLSASISTNGPFVLALQSEPGLAFELQSTTNLLSADWTTLQSLTNVTGSTNILFELESAQPVYFRTRRLK